MIGIGAMLYHLRGGSPKSASDFYGRKIVAARLADDVVHLTFDDGQKIKLWDDGQSCCEHRYMSTDDDLQSLVGHTLTRIEAKAGPTEESNGEPHETCFVEIGTDDGFVTLVNHNEHNGYYGGFGLSIDLAD